MSRSCVRFASLWDLYLWYCRLIGFLTAISLYGAAVEGLLFGYRLYIYLLIIAPIVTFLELVFVGVLITDLLNRESGPSCCQRIWSALKWCDDWRKGVLYLLFSIGCFVQPHKFWVSIIPGCMLVKCSIVYSIKTIRTRREAEELSRRTKLKTYNKFDEEVEDDVEENAVARELQETGYDKEETVADQDDILDV